jgi:SAM-dependent methyltransferase
VFKHIEAFKGTNWGDVLDAGTGFASMQWLQGVGAKSVTGITASGSNAERLNKVCGVSCQVIVGDWADPDTLKDRKFDTVLAEYLLGAVDSTLMLNVFTTLKMHMKDEGILIIVGTEPLNDSAIISEEEHMLARVTKVRDASLALSGKRAIKQFPLSFYLKLLEQSGLEVIDITLFPVVYGDPWISSQLSIASQTIQNAKTLSNKFASGLLEEIDLLKSMSSSEEGAFCYGADFVISAVIPQNISIQ